MGYVVAWIVIYAASAGLCATAWYVARKRPYVAVLASGICAIWLLVPWPLDEQGHKAPLSIVIPFRLFFDLEADASGALAFALPLTAILVAGHFGVQAYRSYRRRVK